MKKLILITGTILGCISLSYSQTSSMNYVGVKTMTKAIKDENALESLTSSSKMEQIIYYDGLGRAIQQIDQNGTPGGRNLITPMVYDEFGRQPKSYLPYTDLQGNPFFKDYESDWNTAQPYYYQNAKRQAHTLFPYAEQSYENSPLNRVTEQSAPGSSWKMASGHTIQKQYLYNSINEVRLWTTNFSSTPRTTTVLSALGSTFYPQGTLTKTITTDEHGSPMIDFHDNLGRLVKRMLKDGETSSGEGGQTTTYTTTYYVYDDFGRLAVVIPPKAYHLMETNNDYNTTNLNEDLIFKYAYDEYGRIKEKKIPGAAPVYMMYNKLNQVVLQQDGEMRSNNKWLFFKYDALGRVIMSGTYLNGSRSNTQSLVNSMTQFFESSNTSTTGYTNTCFPTVHDQVLTIQYYDDYDINNDGSEDFTQDGEHYDFYAGQSSTYSTEYSIRTNGFPTISKTLILDNAGTPNYQWQYLYYDELGRLIQDKKANYPGGIATVQYAYNFSNQPIETRLENIVKFSGQPTVTTTVSKYYSYDHMNRLKTTQMKIGSGSKFVLSNLMYNDLGQVVEKNIKKNPNIQPIGMNPDNAYLQSVDYVYNIRGWLTHINNCDLSNDMPLGWGNSGALDLPAHHVTDRFKMVIIGESGEYGDQILLNIIDEKVNTEGQAYEQGPRYEILSREVASIILSNNEKNPEMYDILEQFTNLPMEINYYAIHEEDSITDSLIYALTHTKMKQALNEIDLFDSDIELMMSDELEDYVRQDLTQDVTNDDNNDLWGMCLTYDEGFTQLHGDAQFNGNISGVKWKSKTNNLKKGYGYQYDDLNRLTTAEYASYNAPGNQWNGDQNHYTTNNITYDKNGNILSLNRQGLVNSSSFGMMDQLTYTYDGNQLKSIEDVVNSNSHYNDFINLASATTEYTYNQNGSMTSDANTTKGISYNILNLPQEISVTNGGNKALQFVYNAKGEKLAKKRLANGNGNPVTETVYYNNGMQYTENASGASIDFFAHEEGRATSNGSGGFNMEYQIKDHLGNLRLAFTDANNNHKIDNNASEIIQENNYYAFGLNHKYTTPPNQTGPVNKYQYNGKELLDEYGIDLLDYGARMYDATIGRWHVVDQLAEKYLHLSPYNYVANNPIKYLDPDGKGILPTNPESKNALHAALGGFGVSSEQMGSLLRITPSAKNKEIMTSQLHGTGENGIQTRKEFQSYLKKNKIKLNKSEQANLYKLYSNLHAQEIIEIGVLSKPTVTSEKSEYTYDTGDDENYSLVEGTVVENKGTNPSNNENYKTLIEDFGADPNSLDDYTNEDGYVRIPYKPMDGRKNPNFNVTVVVDGTGKSNRELGETLIQALPNDIKL